MGNFSDFEFSPNQKAFKRDTLRISNQGKRFSGHLTILKFIDKDTNQIVAYLPSFNISGYGESKEKAFEMVKFSLDDLFEKLSSLSLNKLREELARYGWKKDIFRNKEFSKTFVDIEGNLKNFNAVDDRIERLSLVA
jgi:hypothetical protein